VPCVLVNVRSPIGTLSIPLRTIPPEGALQWWDVLDQTGFPCGKVRILIRVGDPYVDGTLQPAASGVAVLEEEEEEPELRKEPLKFIGNPLKPNGTQQATSRCVH
jgi:hypothetical protein